MKNVLDSFRFHITIYRKIYLVFSIVSILIMILTYVFLHKDFASADDVIAIYDLSVLALYQFISMIVLSSVISAKFRTLKAGYVELLNGVWNVVIPMIIVLFFPMIYILINLQSFNDMTFGTFDLSGGYILYYFAGTLIGVIIQYYTLLSLREDKTKIERFLPVLLAVIYGVVFLIMGGLFELLVVRDELTSSEYFRKLNIFDNIAFSVMGLLSLYMVFSLFRQYNITSKIQD